MGALEVIVVIVAILIGLFVVAPGLIKGDEDAQKAIAQMREYQGYVGVVVGVFGVIAFVVLLVERGWRLLFELSIAGSAIILALLGFLLGYQLISEKVLTNNEGAKGKAEAFQARWDPRQNLLGWIAIVLGTAALILYALR